MAIQYFYALYKTIWKNVINPARPNDDQFSIKTTFRASITSLNQKKFNKNDQKEFFGVRRRFLLPWYGYLCSEKGLLIDSSGSE